MKKYIACTISSLALVVLALPVLLGFHVPLVHADNFGVDALSTKGQQLGLGNSSPIDIVFNIIKFVLGLLGLIAVCLILYAGFLWMTSAGDEKKITAAKGIMKAGIIGLAIVFLAVSVSTYVINQLKQTTGATG